MDRSQRLALYFAELKQAPAAHDRASAHALLAKILNGIEDAHSGVPNDPENWMTDERLYPPQDDQEQPSPIAGAAVFLARGHSIWIGDNGAIRIENRRQPHRGRIELDKPGADGALCPKPD
jgi:hypothetical protein